MSWKIMATEVELMPEGKHTGTITKVERRDDRIRNNETATYADFFIKPDDFKYELKVGFPANISENSGLGKFLVALGIPIVPKKENDVEETINKRVSYLVVNVKEKDGNVYNRVVKDSIKPI